MDSSYLDTTIIRAERRRDLLNAANQKRPKFALPICDLGLGNGRAFDHLRELNPDCEIFGFDKKQKAHPTSIPKPGYMVIGEIEKTFPVWISEKGPASLIHVDLSIGDKGQKKSILRWVEPMLTDALEVGGLLLCDLTLSKNCWSRQTEASLAASGRDDDDLQLFVRIS